MYVLNILMGRLLLSMSNKSSGNSPMRPTSIMADSIHSWQYKDDSCDSGRWLLHPILKYIYGVIIIISITIIGC